MSVKIGLALGGGAMRGLAHIGVIEVLEQEGIEIAYVAGCSIGAIIGAAYCCGAPMPMLEKLVMALEDRDLIDVTLPRQGLVKGVRAQSIIRTLTHDKNFDQTNIPFAAIAVDLPKAELVVLNTGKIYTAVRASMSIPGVFEPVVMGDRLLVDGGAMQRVPLAAARAMGDELLVGVDIGYRGEPREQEKTASTLDIINQTLDLMGWEITRLQEQLADVMILPKVRHINPYTMKQAQECIELGRVAARERVEDIKNAALKRAAELEQRKGEVESSGQ